MTDHCSEIKTESLTMIYEALRDLPSSLSRSSKLAACPAHKSKFQASLKIIVIVYWVLIIWRNHSKHFMWINSFNSHKNPAEPGINSSILQKRTHRNTKQWSMSSRDTQLGSDRAGISVLGNYSRPHASCKFHEGTVNPMREDLCPFPLYHCVFRALY